MRIQVQSLENVFIGRDSHEPQTGLVSSFKRVWEYPDKKKSLILSCKVFDFFNFENNIQQSNDL
jgi:hypothetical protein